MIESFRLNKSLIETSLSHSMAQLLTELQVLEVTASTSDWVMNRLQQGGEKFIACIANRQTAGRGRNGKVWRSPSNANIYMSLGTCFDVSLVSQMGGLSLACGVIVVRLLNSMGVSAQLKWPNDILVDDKKLAGILVETRIKAKQVFVVVGLGLNVKMPAHETLEIDQAWVDLNSLLTRSDINLNRNNIVAQLLNALITGLLQYQKTGFDSFANDWKKFDMLRGRSVIIKTHEDEFDAEVLGVDAAFALRVKINNKEKTFYAADIKLKLNPAC